MSPKMPDLLANCRPPAICPECRDGKCKNCDGTAWDNYHDEPAPCDCEH